ncbi:leucine-rich repeat-containing protein Bf66946-like [Lissotriton helveticus]
MAPTGIQVLPMVFSALLFSAMAWGRLCPSICKCTLEEEGVSADCGGAAGEPSNVTAIPEGFPPDIFSVCLAHHNISELTKTSFQGLDGLSVLYLFANQIKSIDIETFTNMTSLIVLDLTYNKLTTLKVEHLLPLEGSLQELYVDNNPWHCTCELLPFQRWLRKVENKVSDSVYITCATPKSVKGRSLLGLTQKELGCQRPFRGKKRL